MLDAPDLSEWDANWADMDKVYIRGTTRFWGDPFDASRDHGEYSEGNTCPLCAKEGVETRITNRATLCKTHRNRVNAKTPKDVMRCIRAARRKKQELEDAAQETVYAVARSIVPAMARVEER